MSYEIKELLEKIRNEPNFHMWIHKGFLCIIKRNEYLGHLCGYVGLNKNHTILKDVESYDDLDLKVHWGLTFLDTWFKDVFPDLIFMGFDCAHCNDITPYSYFNGGIQLADATYKDFNFVKNEIEGLVEQILIKESAQ